MSVPAAIVVLSTLPDEAKGREIARVLVEERLAACVTVTAAVRSLYWWQGKIADEVEFVLIIKTRRALFRRLEARLKEIHPYTVPEIIALPVTAGSAAYLKWIGEETS